MPCFYGTYTTQVLHLHYRHVVLTWPVLLPCCYQKGQSPSAMLARFVDAPGAGRPELSGADPSLLVRLAVAIARIGSSPTAGTRCGRWQRRAWSGLHEVRCVLSCEVPLVFSWWLPWTRADAGSPPRPPRLSRSELRVPR